MKKILFVCTGNTCRSPMAEGIFNSITLNHHVLKGQFYAHSAGLAAFNGDCSSSNSIEALRSKWNIDISTHVSKNLAEADLKEAYLVLTMTRNHKNAILSAYHGMEDKVFTLKEYAFSRNFNSSLDIPDPFGGNLQVYKMCSEEINEAVVSLISRLELECNF